MYLPLIKIENVAFRALRGFSCTIHSGERVALLGSNGCGKSSLFEIISGLELPESGRLLRSFRKLSYVPQEPVDSFIPWYTLKKNIRLSLACAKLTYNEKKAATLAADLGFDFSLNSYPLELSGGQLQLASIHKALITCPDLLLLDEPFSALDAEKRALVLRALHTLPSQTALLISAHREDEIVSLCTRELYVQRTFINSQDDRVLYPASAVAGRR